MFRGTITEEQTGYLKAVMATYEGRLVVYEILRLGELRTSSYAAESALDTAYNNGLTDFGLSVENTLRAVDLGALRLMEDEALERDAHEKILRTADDARVGDDDEHGIERYDDDSF